MGKKRHAGNIKLSGGILCLDFVNTVHCYGCTDLGEYLNTYDDLLAWSRHAGTINEKEAKILSRKAARHPAQARSAHKRAIDLRETVYRVFTISLTGQSPAPEDLALFNGYLGETMMRSQIVKTQDGFYWDMTGNKEKLDWILNPIIGSTADLLISDDFRQVKKCADPVCGWLFLDTSRNRSRRWCDMADCGNRAKASRFYKKNKNANVVSSSFRVRPARSKPKPKIERHLL